MGWKFGRGIFIYILIIDFVQLFARNSKFYVSESHFKDNPALSMLNDSDDDVIYGWVMEYFSNFVFTVW